MVQEKISMSELRKPENPARLLQSKAAKKLDLIRAVFILLMLLLIVFGPITIQRKYIQKLIAEGLIPHAEQWPVHFQDTFDSNAPTRLADWAATDGTTDERVNFLPPTDDRLEISVGPTGEPGVREAFFNTAAPAPDLFWLTMDVHTPFSCYTGLVFRGNSTGEYYLFLTANDHYTVEILRRNADGDLPRQAIIPNTRFPASIHQPESLGVLGVNHSYYFFVNHIFLDWMHDSRLHGERTGLEIIVCQNVATQSVFQFDNFTLRAPGEIPPP
jgi:hypothetical protein